MVKQKPKQAQTTFDNQSKTAEVCKTTQAGAKVELLAKDVSQTKVHRQVHEHFRFKLN